MKCPTSAPLVAIPFQCPTKLAGITRDRPLPKHARRPFPRGACDRSRTRWTKLKEELMSWDVAISIII
jgi:hypothetical protein